MSFQCAIETSASAREMRQSARMFTLQFRAEFARPAVCADEEIKGVCVRAFEYYEESNNSSFPSAGIGVPVDGLCLKDWIRIAELVS